MNHGAGEEEEEEDGGVEVTLGQRQKDRTECG